MRTEQHGYQRQDIPTKEHEKASKFIPAVVAAYQFTQQYFEDFLFLLVKRSLGPPLLL